jgi:two-component system NtrC family sensor kinase
MQDGRFCYVNPFFSSATGYTAEELVGKDSLEIVVREDRDVVRDNTIKMLKGEIVSPYQFRVICKDNGIIWVMAAVKSIQYHGRQAVLGNYMEIIEREQAETRLREAEEEKSVLLEEAPVSIIHADLDGRITYFNKRFEQESGYSREEIIGKLGLQLGWFAPDTNEYFAQRMAARLRGSPAKHWETEFKCKDGRSIWVELEGNILQKLGVPVGFQIIASNITERKEAEEALRRSEERYRTILDEMEEGYYEVDIAGNFTFVNDAMTRILGYSRDELIGMNYKAYTPAEAVKPILQAYNDVYRTGEPLEWFPMPEIRKDGTRILAEDSVFPLRNERREVFGFRGISRDITERKRMEKALRQSEENYRALFDNSVIGTIVLDAETMRILVANQAAARLFEFDSVEDGIGLNPLYLIVPEDKERVINAITKELFEQDLRVTHEFRAITKRGTRIWVSATGARIRHEGRLAGLISFTDISEQRSHRDRLVMTDRLASLGEMASGAAHELNNPLTTIIGFSQLLLRKEVPDDIREDLKLINSEAERAADVTRNLLTFAGRHPPMQKLNQIKDIIEDVLRLRVYDHKARGIEVERQLAPDLPEVMVDYFQMQQVFMNIIINAEYFMINAHNRGTLAITAKEENDTVVILFTDDGPGIPPENLGRVFDPFFTTKEAGKGTGLGLSICHGIVTEHGGQIYARSQLGKGATIVVELPVEGERRS